MHLYWIISLVKNSELLQTVETVFFVVKLTQKTKWHDCYKIQGDCFSCASMFPEEIKPHNILQVYKYQD